MPNADLRIDDRAYARSGGMYAKPRPGMRQALARLNRFISYARRSPNIVSSSGCVPRCVPDHNLSRVRPRSTITSSASCTLASMKSGRWRMGTHSREAESDSATPPPRTFETFPFPWPPGREPADDPRVQAIAAAAADLVAKRDAWLNPTQTCDFGTLEASSSAPSPTSTTRGRPGSTWRTGRSTRPCSPRTGWPKDLTDDEILARLLALNLERAGKQRG